MAEEQTAAPDRTAILEQRLSRMEGYIQSSDQRHKQERQAESNRQLEARFASELTRRSQVIDQAEQKLAAAHGSEEPAAIARAQRELSEAVSQRERLQADYDSFKRAVEARSRAAEEEAGSTQRQVDTTNLDQWRSDNPWYGSDPERTQAAKEAHQAIMQRGDIPEGSIKYFAEIDRAVRSRYPDRFEKNPGESGEGGMPTLNSGHREPTPAPDGALRMTESMQKAAARFGMTPEQWKESRDKAVAKGILSKDPTYGAILS